MLSKICRSGSWDRRMWIIIAEPRKPSCGNTEAYTPQYSHNYSHCLDLRASHIFKFGLKLIRIKDNFIYWQECIYFECSFLELSLYSEHNVCGNQLLSSISKSRPCCPIWANTDLTGEVINIRVENCIQLIEVGGGWYMNRATYLSVMSIADDKNWQ